jgi:esterase/lipase superfamily enzyme
MAEIGIATVPGMSRRRAGMRGWLPRLASVLLLAVPALVFAQSADLLNAYQDFETAKADHDVAAALRYGDHALQLTQAEHSDPQELVSLLRNLGEFAAQSDKDQLAVQYYERALKLQESTLGVNHPDLVPTLTSLADLSIKDHRNADADALLQRILAIERAAYGERHENVLATLHQLRNLYTATNNVEGLARVNSQLQPPAATERGLPALPGSAVASARHYKQGQGYATVRVFYGTNRAPTGEVKPALFYGAARGELQYGYVDVTIPDIHKEAELETEPHWSDFTFGVDEATSKTRYVLLDKVVPLAKDGFVRAVRQQFKDDGSSDVFIFVHGFNNTFEDAARRTAQLAYDLDFDGTPMLYSWPSQGSTTGYAVDEAAVGISGRKMAEFLDTVVAQTGAKHIHLIAHSMGNRALIEALQTYLAKRSPDNRQHIFGQIVFTAPDVDRDYFVDAIDALRGSAERVTLYASDSDYALRSSQLIHGAPRAGTAGDVIIRMAGIDTIDMSGVSADMLGHAYFAANSGAIYDLFRLLWRGDAPPQRCGMSDRRAAGTLAVWRFNVEMCKGDDMLEAGVILKRFGDLARQRVVTNIATLTDPSEKLEWQGILKRLDGLLAPAAAPAGGATR